MILRSADISSPPRSVGNPEPVCTIGEEHPHCAAGAKRVRIRHAAACLGLVKEKPRQTAHGLVLDHVRSVGCVLSDSLGRVGQEPRYFGGFLSRIAESQRSNQLQLPSWLQPQCLCSWKGEPAIFPNLYHAI